MSAPAFVREFHLPLAFGIARALGVVALGNAMRTAYPFGICGRGNIAFAQGATAGAA